MLSIIGSLLVGALAVVAPRPDATVETLRTEQLAYLKTSRAARHRAMGDAAIRRELLAAGSWQKPLRLEWSGADSDVWELSIAAEGGAEQTFSISGRTFAEITNLEIGRRYRWFVFGGGESAGGSFVTSAQGPRTLRAGGVSNFRDLGGWMGRGGARVRQNMIFRSAGLRDSSKNRGGSVFNARYDFGAERITAAGKATLAGEFRIRTDLELRTDRECAGMVASVVPGAKFVRIPFVAYEHIDEMERGKEPFAKMFRLFADPASYPILMHCSGGRDRTGTVAFLLSGLLGVSEEDLFRDWEFSVFSDAGAKFSPARIAGLREYLRKQHGKTIGEQVESFVLSCGVMPEEIAAFRKIMLGI